MEDRIVSLRQRGTAAVARARQRMAVAGIIAGVVAAAGAAYVIYRVTRPPTFRQRLVRMVPDPIWRLRDTVELGWRRTIPPMRLYVGDRQVGEEPAGSAWEKVAVRAAQAFGTAVASAVVARLLQQLSGRQRRG
jgi:hypothetical protein